MNSVKTWPGKPYPLGASHDGEGTNFSLFSEVAEWVELCLFDEHGHQTAVDLPKVTAYCWHGYLPGIKPGQRYDAPCHYMDYTGTVDGFIGEGKRRLEAGTERAVGAKFIKVYRRFEQAAA